MVPPCCSLHLQTLFHFIYPKHHFHDATSWTKELHRLPPAQDVLRKERTAQPLTGSSPSFLSGTENHRSAWRSEASWRHRDAQRTARALLAEGLPFR
ncbi:hypothetical protein AAY473_018339 [Plecturocebus cupreus]